MPVSPSDDSATARPTVFLSYASEDRRAAQLIRDTLPGFGMEVWYDESDLVGGDAWDQKIRGQIRACDYFMPVISAHTEARHEGYFRREWRLAVERTLDMADDHVFLLPVVIDGTVEAGARVPEKFRAVQWLRLPDGQPTAALEALCRRLVSGEVGPPPAVERPLPPRGSKARPPAAAGDAALRQLPPFPREEPGQRVRFLFQVAGWGLQSAWAGFKRLPRWIRIVIYVWIAIMLMSRCSASDDHRNPHISAAQTHKLREIAARHVGNWTAADTARLISEFAKETPAYTGAAAAHDAVLAIPFAAPPGNAAAQKLAASVFTQVYGRLAIGRHGQVALAQQPLPALDVTAAVAHGRAHHAAYVVYGAVDGVSPKQQLEVRIVSVADGSTAWSKSYPLTGADPTDIASEVSARVPRQNEN